MKLSNDVEKYEIEVTKMGQNYSLFFTVQGWLSSGGVTPIDSIVTPATAHGQPVTWGGVATYSSVYFRRCVLSQQSTVEIQRSLWLKPWKSALSTVKIPKRAWSKFCDCSR